MAANLGQLRNYCFIFWWMNENIGLNFKFSKYKPAIFIPLTHNCTNFLKKNLQYRLIRQNEFAKTCVWEDFIEKMGHKMFESQIFREMEALNQTLGLHSSVFSQNGGVLGQENLSSGTFSVQVGFLTPCF